MRLSIVALGLVIAVVGAVLWLVPLAPATSTIQIPVGDAYDFGIPTGLVLGSFPYTVSWTMADDGSSSENVTIYSCGTSSACSAGTNASTLASRSGPNGSVSWESQPGLYYLLVPSNTANVTVDYKQPLDGGLAGLGLLGVGVLVVLSGAVIGRRTPPKEKATAPANPKTEEPTTEGRAPTRP